MDPTKEQLIEDENFNGPDDEPQRFYRCIINDLTEHDAETISTLLVREGFGEEFILEDLTEEDENPEANP